MEDMVQNKDELLLNRYLETAVLLEHQAEQAYKTRANMIKVIKALKMAGDAAKNEWLRANKKLINDLYNTTLNELVDMKDTLLVFVELGEALNPDPNTNRN